MHFLNNGLYGDFMKFLIATNNKKKLREIGAILEKLGVEAVSLSEAGVECDAEETGTTFEENSFIKAEAAMKISGLPTIADDSGLEVDALHGEPGVYSARYAGEPCDDKKNNDKLLCELEKIGDNQRSASFVSVVTILFPKGSEIGRSVV